MRDMRLLALALASLTWIALGLPVPGRGAEEAPAASAGSVSWIEDVDLATTLARRTGRPILAQFR